MSSVDAAITAALLNNALQDFSSIGSRGNSQTGYNYEVAYFRLKNDFANLQNQYDQLKHFSQTSYKQTEVLMTFINYGRICSGHEPLTLSKIVSTVKLDPMVSQLYQHSDKVGVDSKIGFITQTEFYWQNIKTEVFDYLKHVMDTGDDYQNLYPDFNKADALQGVYGEISGYQRFSNLRLNNQMLVERNRKLKIENCDLLDEVDRLNEDNAKLRAQLEALQAAR